METKEKVLQRQIDKIVKSYNQNKNKQTLIVLVDKLLKLLPFRSTKPLPPCLPNVYPTKEEIKKYTDDLESYDERVEQWEDEYVWGIQVRDMLEIKIYNTIHKMFLDVVPGKYISNVIFFCEKNSRSYHTYIDTMENVTKIFQ